MICHLKLFLCFLPFCNADCSGPHKTTTTTTNVEMVKINPVFKKEVLYQVFFSLLIVLASIMCNGLSSSDRAVSTEQSLEVWLKSTKKLRRRCH